MEEVTAQGSEVSIGDGKRTGIIFFDDNKPCLFNYNVDVAKNDANIKSLVNTVVKTIEDTGTHDINGFEGKTADGTPMRIFFVIHRDDLKTMTYPTDDKTRSARLRAAIHQNHMNYLLSLVWKNPPICSKYSFALLNRHLDTFGELVERVLGVSGEWISLKRGDSETKKRKILVKIPKTSNEQGDDEKKKKKKKDEKKEEEKKDITE